MRIACQPPCRNRPISIFAHAVGSPPPASNTAPSIGCDTPLYTPAGLAAAAAVPPRESLGAPGSRPPVSATDAEVRARARVPRAGRGGDGAPQAQQHDHTTCCAGGGARGSFAAERLACERGATLCHLVAARARDACTLAHAGRRRCSPLRAYPARGWAQSGADEMWRTDVVVTSSHDEILRRLRRGTPAARDHLTQTHRVGLNVAPRGPGLRGAGADDYRA